MQFTKANKTKKKLRAALLGTSGSGKTYSCLAIATALGGRIAVIDTERGSASMYAARFDFDVLELQTFGPLVYVQALQAAAKDGYDSVIIDSLSHAWMGKGGALAQVDAKGGRFDAWKDVTPQQLEMVDAILAFPGHVFVTMRVKSEYVLEEGTNRAGKKTTVPKKVGVQPVQRDGLEYEFDLVGDMDDGHVWTISKSRLLEHVAVGQKFVDPGTNVADAWRAFQDDATDAPPRTSAPEAGVVDSNIVERLREATEEELPALREECTALPAGPLRKAASDAYMTRKAELKARAA